MDIIFTLEHISSPAYRFGFSSALDTRIPDFALLPYARLPNGFIPVSLREQVTLGLSQTILLCFEKAVYRRPDEIPRQFGLEKEESVSASSTHMPNSSALASENSAQTRPSEDTVASQNVRSGAVVALSSCDCGGTKGL
ncbi:hypothetical protein RHMOL_Rhmol10G0130600 [Rhododendron molle]|uniref:Uncharacterized protein n=1 Tax=Rhododendron molle TaxID=49168 RepID=A0ACC0M1E6_RHOML|nr:hypothetical protein RHMOL_Rhmol10G0130600 [Rhododendron molle]